MFWNIQENRLRAGWRLALQFVLFAVPTFAVLSGGVPLVAALTGLSAENAMLQNGIMAVGGMSATLFSLWIMARFVDKRPMADYGLRINRWWWVDLTVGLVVGAALVSLIFGVGLALDMIRVEQVFPDGIGITVWAALALQLGIFILVGIWEEMMSRGYQLKNAAEGLYGLVGNRPRVAVGLAWLLSSLVFSGLHLLNPGTTMMSFLGISLAGVLLGAGYTLTGSLAVPIGLHITWNFFMGNIYGFSVSGRDSGVSLVDVTLTGSSVWTGGTFGPEAGLLGIMAIIIGLLLVVLYARWRTGNFGLDGSLAVYTPVATTAVPIDTPTIHRVTT